MRKIYLVVILFCAFSTKGLGQTSTGKDFWFGFLEVSDFPTDTLLKYTVKITSQVSTSGTITIPGSGFSQNFTVTAGMVTSIVLPGISVLDSTSDALSNTAVHITSLNNISVFAFTLHVQRNSSMLVLPTTSLGSSYYVMSNMDFAPGTHSYDLSEFLIVSPNTGATVQITPACATRGGHAAGTPFTVTLPPGQVYQVQAKETGTVTGDFTGTKITAVNGTDLFAVIGGVEFAYIGCSGTGEPMSSQMLPVNSWGDEYVVVPTLNDTGDICRILASQAGTKVYINGTLKATLAAGAFYEQTITTASSICASNPIEVARFLQCASCNGYDGASKTRYPNLGDPSMVILHSNSQMFLDSISFDATKADTVPFKIFGATLHYPIDSIFIQIITRTTDKGTMFLDGTNIGASFTTLASNTAYCYTTLGLSFGKATAGVYNAHTLTSTGTGFLAYVTGMGNVSAYMYSVGLNGKFTTNSSTRPDSILTNPAGCITIGNNVQFTGNTSLVPLTWSWNFGDGTTSTSATPTHSYSTTGAKTVSLTVNFSCVSETLTYALNVCTTPLPIELIDFIAKNEKNQVQLSWQTAQEVNNDHFTLEHSVNGIEYAELYNAKGAGNSSVQHNYSYLDKTPVANINYYRLKQVDFDGKQTYFNTISINNEVNNFTVNIGPSPVLAKLNVILNTENNGPATIQLYDVLGNLRMNAINQTNQGSNSIDVDISALPAGIYIVSIEQNEQWLKKRIVKY